MLNLEDDFDVLEENLPEAYYDEISEDEVRFYYLTYEIMKQDHFIGLEKEANRISMQGE